VASPYVDLLMQEWHSPKWSPRIQRCVRKVLEELDVETQLTLGREPKLEVMVLPESTYGVWACRHRIFHAGCLEPSSIRAAQWCRALRLRSLASYRQTGIAIDTGEQRSVGQIKLELGKVSENVTVTAEAAAVNLVTGERSGTLTGAQLDEIALRGRDIFDTVSLMPGVVDTSDGREAPSPTSIQNVFILGGRDDQKNVTVDGVRPQLSQQQQRFRAYRRRVGPGNFTPSPSQIRT
jgi:hypothetical protein